MNSGGGLGLKRSVAAVLAVTFILSGVLVVWGLASPAPSGAANQDDEMLVIAPVASTQPGTSTEPSANPSTGDSPTAPSDAGSQPGQTTTGAAAQPTTAPSAPTGGTGGSTGSTGGGGNTTQPTPAPTPVPTPVPQACGSGGSCSLSDISTHNSAADCRSAINIDGTTSAYAITESFLTAHRDNFKTISTKLCGKVYGSNLKQQIGEHHDGTSFSGSVFQQWINNFYLGPYN